MVMWRSRLTIAILACVSVPLAVEGQDAPRGSSQGPQLVLSETEHDLGRLDPGAAHQVVEVAIRNAGNEPLVVRKVRTTCVCLRADLPELTIPQGHKATLRLEIDPPLVEESIDEQVLIYSNDPVRPVGKIRLTGSLGTAIRLLPQQAFAVGPVYRSDVAQAEIQSILLSSSDGGPLGQVRAVPSHPSIRARVRPSEYGSYEVSISIDNTVPLGVLNQSVKIETEHARTRTVEIPVLGTILGDLDQLGLMVDFGYVQEGQAASKTILVRNHGSRAISVLHGEARLWLPVEIQATPEGRDTKLLIRVPPQPAFTRFTGEIELRTSDPDEPIIRVPMGGGVLSKQPFEQVKVDGNSDRLVAIVKDVLARGEKIPADRFFADVLGGVKDERAIAILLRALTEGNLPVRMRAVQLLEQVKTPQVVDRFRQLITDDQDDFVRQYALLAYARATGKEAIPTLLLALHDDDDWVREYAAAYLGKLGDASVIPALQAALNESDPTTAAAVREALLTVRARAK